MIPKPTLPRQPAAWQRALLDSLTQPADLLAALDLPPDHPALPGPLLRDFPLRVPRSYVRRMRRGDPQDPLFLQVWPQAQEGHTQPGSRTDAVGDLQRLRPGGIIHKYQGRALLIATGACAVHCRYCFRRHFPYGEHLATRGQWAATLAELAADPSIEEVILSGGDPLSLSDAKLAALVEGLETLPQVRRLRIHTRQPVVLPERVDEALTDWLSRTRLQTVVVVHVNHPQEIDAELLAAFRRLAATGATLLNQSVLLRNVNDHPDTLQALSERLFAGGVLPYYLHLLDPVTGAMHFDVPAAAAGTLLQTLSERLPGYLVPRLAREVPGAPSKQVLSPYGLPA